MAANFPTSLPNLPDTNALSVTPRTTFANINNAGMTMRQWMAQVSAEILAIATALGVQGTADTTAILYKVANLPGPTVPQIQTFTSGIWGTPAARQVFNIVNQSDPSPL